MRYMLPAGTAVRLLTSDGFVRIGEHIIPLPTLFDERSVRARPSPERPVWIVLLSTEALVEVQDVDVVRSGAVMDLTTWTH